MPVAAAVPMELLAVRAVVEQREIHRHQQAARLAQPTQAVVVVAQTAWMRVKPLAQAAPAL